MTMASLAWSLKAWCAFLFPVNGRWADRHLKQRRTLLAMEFRTIRHAFIDIPARWCATPDKSDGVSWLGTRGSGAFFRLADAL